MIDDRWVFDYIIAFRSLAACGEICPRTPTPTYATHMSVCGRRCKSLRRDATSVLCARVSASERDNGRRGWLMDCVAKCRADEIVASLTCVCIALI